LSSADSVLPSCAGEGDTLSWVARLQELYPGDIGVVAPLFLRDITLEPGQAMFLPARAFHCYLTGLGIELMANSDNVLRGGLTSKREVYWTRIMVVVLAAFLGPIALIPIAIMAIIAVIKNWDKIWIAIRKTTEVVVNAIIKFINDLGKSFAGVFKMISGVLDKLPGPLKNLIPGFEELQGALADVTATLEDGIQPMDIYNERQEMIKHLQEGLAESAKERADAEEKSAERSVTAMGEVTGAVVAGVDEQMAKQDEQIAKQKEWADKNEL